MAERQVNCCECGKQFSFEIGRGTDRKLCGDACAKLSRDRHLAGRLSRLPHCSEAGCGKLVRSAGSPYCEAHYCRLRRNGHLTLRAAKAELPHSHGYVLEYHPGHWLNRNQKSNRVYQHRRVYFDTHGFGPFNCNWCHVAIDWDCMHVDHINAVRDDNRIENLVASCAKCNQKRGHAKGKETHRRKSMAKIEWQGASLTLGEWAKRLGLSRASLWSRINSGWPMDRVMTEPRGKAGPRSKQVSAQ